MIDPYKLQKQVDIMENNPNCSLVISNGISLNEITKKQYIINPMGDIKKPIYIAKSRPIRKEINPHGINVLQKRPVKNA